jgi:polysaccharide deacetylase 2 family uncharacterized protein YibQ
MRGRRTAGPRSSQLLLGMVIGMILGAALTIGVQLAQHGRAGPAKPPAPAAAPRHPAPQSSHRAPPAVLRQTPPQPPSLPPHQNPEASQGPAIVPAPRSFPGRSGHPRVAIIFDDAGYSLRAAQEVEAIGRPVTISVLPHLAYSTQVAEEAAAHGIQVILHLPVEPDNQSIQLGAGGITVGMSDEEIRRTVVADLATVPTAVGANNHMGSLGTSDPRVMRAVMDVMKSRHLFFVDSMTSRNSVAALVARGVGVPTATRTVFLDNLDEEEYVRGRFRVLINLALARGQAIAIGHVGRVTPRVLASLLSEFDEAGIQLVRVSELVH